VIGEPPRVVFDCVIFAQALINPKGPAGDCLKAAESTECLLHVSAFVLQEIRELPSKLPLRYGITAERVEMLIKQVHEYAETVIEVPEQFKHPTDPKDAGYINLALGTNSELVVSRDRHLLVLMDVSTPEGQSFQRRFPQLRIVRPVEFLRILGRTEA
jgi:putative PIN family toxin of toxin-antitoxin system